MNSTTHDFTRIAKLPGQPGEGSVQRLDISNIRPGDDVPESMRQPVGQRGFAQRWAEKAARLRAFAAIDRAESVLPDKPTFRVETEDQSIFAMLPGNPKDGDRVRHGDVIYVYGRGTWNAYAAAPLDRPRIVADLPAPAPVTVAEWQRDLITDPKD